MKTRVRILGLFVAVAVCFACQSTGASSRELLDALARDFPRIDGSTSAMPLQRKLACDVYGIPWTWSTGDLENGLRNIIPDGEKDPSPEAAAAVFAIRHSGTNGAYMALIERKADFILVARAPSPCPRSRSNTRRASGGPGRVRLSGTHNKSSFQCHIERGAGDLHRETHFLGRARGAGRDRRSGP